MKICRHLILLLLLPFTGIAQEFESYAIKPINVVPGLSTIAKPRTGIFALQEIDLSVDLRQKMLRSQQPLSMLMDKPKITKKFRSPIFDIPNPNADKDIQFNIDSGRYDLPNRNAYNGLYRSIYKPLPVIRGNPDFQ